VALDEEYWLRTDLLEKKLKLISKGGKDMADCKTFQIGIKHFLDEPEYKLLENREDEVQTERLKEESD
jgi:hypothetical protein